MTTADQPLDGIPRYRFIAGPNDATFCDRVSAQLDVGCQLHGSPVLAIDSEVVVAGRTVIWPDRSQTRTDYALRQLRRNTAVAPGVVRHFVETFAIVVAITLGGIGALLAVKITSIQSTPLLAASPAMSAVAISVPVLLLSRRLRRVQIGHP